MSSFDPRLTPARPELAAKHLEGRLTAARFVEGEGREVVEPQAPLRRAPAPDAPLATEALRGERITVYETSTEGWSWGQLETDGYVGWLPTSAIGPPGPTPTHKVVALRTLAFPGPSIKLSPVAAFSLGCRLAIARYEEPFAVTGAGEFFPSGHLAPVGVSETDFVAVAERLLGTPYLWGGKTSLGLDCSGLVQLALTACGMPCPRDSDMQENVLGAPLDERSQPRRGDLLFFAGHVAFVRDRATLLHANSFHMAVALEPIEAAIPRMRAQGCEVTSRRRLDCCT